MQMKPLNPEQRRAAHPGRHVWVSASAGTGKTQVLTARVLRLLLAGAEPERILCLTYTRAAAAEMQTRIFQQLAAWVRAEPERVGRDLAALGEEEVDDRAVSSARRLFARVLEARGGLRIQTLHSFAQSLLASFPLEAGVPVGFEILDERTSVQLGREVLAERLTRAMRDGEQAFLDDIGRLSVRLHETGVTQVIRRLARHRHALEALGEAVRFEERLRAWLDLPGEGDSETILARALADERFDCEGLRRFGALLTRHGTNASRKHAATIRRWLERDGAGRCRGLDDVRSVFITATGTPKSKLVVSAVRAADPGADQLAAAFFEAFTKATALRARLDAAELAALHLRVGQLLCRATEEAKARSGALDFDDVITHASRLLSSPGLGEWVRYKLDRQVDHILVDEGQDTNGNQWAIIDAIAAEFFAGEGAVERPRTIFAVGDFKQSIFGFQGSEPALFEQKRGSYLALAQAAGHPLEAIDLDLSFRSTPAVLAVVDAVIGQVGHAALGLARAVPEHRPHRREASGAVILWDPVGRPQDAVTGEEGGAAAAEEEGGEAAPAEEATEEEATEEAAGESVGPGAARPWLPSAEVLFARRLARQIRLWIRDGLSLPSRGGQPARPRDILILVRKRSELVPALVSALHVERVPVAGVDRLSLTEPLAVRDLLALVRFALQPEDDLTLATLLTSPFLGWDQEALFALSHDRPGRLWRALRRAADVGEGRAAAAVAWLRQLLSAADLATPYRFLETILSGPLGGRARLLERLGGEALEAIEELLNQALLFETTHAPNLQAFLSWIEAEEVEVKRDPELAADAVRIMTVHGAKGLQAPVVVLADAVRAGELRVDEPFLASLGGEPYRTPLFVGGKAGHVGPLEALATAARQAAAEEDLRLLYVALTRAEDMLFVGGALGKRESRGEGEAKAESWHGRVAAALEALGARTGPEPLWGRVRAYAPVQLPPQPQPHPPSQPPSQPRPQPLAQPLTERVTPPLTETRPGAGQWGAPPSSPFLQPTLPAWLHEPAPVEARPGRPLVPSRIGEDDVAAPPAGPLDGAAALRGRLIHRLFERLPPVARAERRSAGLAWLVSRTPQWKPEEQRKLVDAVLGIIEMPELADLFDADALAEAPIAALVGETMVMGTVDRLLVTEDRVAVVDFKTGRRVPASAAAAPVHHKQQMAAYWAALRCIFPGRPVAAMLLYTEGPRLIPLPPALLASHAPQS